MIQIFVGTFGKNIYRMVVPITNSDGPQKFDPELEARLVKKGVAKYVDEKPVAPAPAAEPEREPGATSEPDGTPAAPEYDEDMILDELKEVATAYGVDASAMRKKAYIIDAIEKAKAAADDGKNGAAQHGDDEKPPALGAADPVKWLSTSRKWSLTTAASCFSTSPSSVRSTRSTARPSPSCWMTTP